MSLHAPRLSGLAVALAVTAACWSIAGSAVGTAAAATPTSAPSGESPLGRFSSAWLKLHSYTCVVTAHEVLGTRVQDRTYNLTFRKPYDTKLEITGGNGRGGAAVWHGGDTLRGHQGGFVSFIKLNLSIHDPRATTIRGTTIAEASFGAIFDHVKSLKGTIESSESNDLTTIDFSVPDPTADDNVTKERVVLAANGLPSEYDQWEGDALVRKVVYTDVVVDPLLADSAFNL